MGWNNRRPPSRESLMGAKTPEAAAEGEKDAAVAAAAGTEQAAAAAAGGAGGNAPPPATPVASSELSVPGESLPPILPQVVMSPGINYEIGRNLAGADHNALVPSRAGWSFRM